MNMPVLNTSREIFQNNLKKKTKQDKCAKGGLRLAEMFMTSGKYLRQ